MKMFSMFSDSPTTSMFVVGLLLILLPAATEGFLPTSSLSLGVVPRDQGKPRSETLSTNANSVGEVAPPQPVRWRELGRHVVPLSTAVIIGSFSVMEILESSRELIAKWHIQHWRGAHGITLLAVIRLGRSVAILETQAEELEEQLEELTEENEKRAPKGPFHSVKSAMSRFITSPVTAIVACIMAAVASLFEIVDDLKPGAHHGAALLALSELYYQVQRLRNVTGRRKRQLFKFSLGIPIALAAAVFAGMELFEDIQPGAHHGLAILALAELVENINRSKVLY